MDNEKEQQLCGFSEGTLHLLRMHLENTGLSLMEVMQRSRLTLDERIERQRKKIKAEFETLLDLVDWNCVLLSEHEIAFIRHLGLADDQETEGEANA